MYKVVLLAQNGYFLAKLWLGLVYNTHMRFGKQFLKARAQKFLEALVRIKLRRINPKIIGVTGSFGKTSVKQAIYEVLKSRFRVAQSPKSLNTEIGLLLAVLEQPSGFSSPLKWGKILFSACVNAFFGKKYDFFVLEYGADKPGDIEHLAAVVKPDFAVITHVSRTHQAQGQFKNIKEVFEEKAHLAKCLDKSGAAILNMDDELLGTLRGTLAAKTFWFSGAGNSKKDAPSRRINGLTKICSADLQLGLADIFADHLSHRPSRSSATGLLPSHGWASFEKNSIAAKIHIGDAAVFANFPVAGTFHVDLFLPALMIGILNGISLEEGIAALQFFKLPPGRMSLIEGKNGSALIDSSYNASPETVRQALNLLKEFPGKRKIAVLGNMNELGDYSDEAHKSVGQSIGPWLDLLITVGESAGLIADSALKNGLLKSKIKTLSDAQAAAQLLETEIKEGDVVLFKGSQDKVRLERAVKKLMAHPEDAKKLLCRQEPEWEEII